MPELPETHTISKILNDNLSGKRISKVLVEKNYNPLPDTHTFIQAITGREIKSVGRVAKNILLKLDNESYILFHLAMTGRLLLWKDKVGAEKSIKVMIHFSDGMILTFSDVRMFGKAAVLSSKQHEELRLKYGPEPLDENTTAHELSRQIKKKRTNIKNALLDQGIISGIGNIYATDALYLAKIHPLTGTLTLTENEISVLFEKIKEVLNESISLGGATLDDRMYVDPFGKEGEYQKHFKIYSKSVCPACGTKVEFMKISGRGTYFCPNCQPLNKNENN